MHATGVLVDPIVAPVGQADELQAGLHARFPEMAPEGVQPGEEAQVLAPGEVGVESDLLGHVADARLCLCRSLVDGLAGHHHLPTVAAQQATDHRDGGRLAGSVGAEEAVALPGRNLEAHAVDGDPAAKPSPQPLTDENGVARHARDFRRPKRSLSW